MKIDISRQVVLDTETTGFNKCKPHYEGHRIIEIGAVEIINRRLTQRQFHVYLKPNRCIDQDAFRIHGISDDFLRNKPKFSDIVNDLLDFISGSELIMHNASFDIGFIDYELSMLHSNVKKISSFCTIIDTLQLARTLFPGKKNSLDALCERYSIDNTTRDFHNALFDAKLLADVFLLMTGGQIKFSFMENVDINSENIHEGYKSNKLKEYISYSTRIIYASQNEVLAHEHYLDILEKGVENVCCIWRNKF